jgi:gamma-glutamyltranspeptidase/glutathione hydrolase
LPVTCINISVILIYRLKCQFTIKGDPLLSLKIHRFSIRLILLAAFCLTTFACSEPASAPSNIASAKAAVAMPDSYSADVAKGILSIIENKPPLSAHKDMYLDEQGNVVPYQSVIGVLSSGVPGTLAGMWLAHEKYGSLPWKELVQPAVILA